MIFESHAHYDDKAFDEDREALLEGLKENGIGYVINIGANIETTKNTIGLAKKYPFIYGAVGVHPSDTDELDEEKFAWLKKQCAHPKIVAVGEIGLDYYWDEPDKKIQKLWFKRQLDMARETKLPVIIHSRDAAKDTLDIMKAANAGEMGGVIEYVLPLFFLYKGNREGIFGYGLLFWDRRRSHIPECKKTERSGRIYPYRKNFTRDGQPLFGAGAL